MPPNAATADPIASLAQRYRDVRRHTAAICAPLSPEDCVIQSMPDVSPMRWHLAHTTWFFETFVLKATGNYRPTDASFEYLFNSYYNTVGDPFPRDRRGLLSRPGVAEIHRYREQVDAAMLAWFDGGASLDPSLLEVVEIGLNHEQQHQELMLTDIKHILSCNPADPVYVAGQIASQTCKQVVAPESAGDTGQWQDYDQEGIYAIGHRAAGQTVPGAQSALDDPPGFAFDNESPRHRVYLQRFSIARDLVTNGQYLEFIQDGGYRRPEFWLSMGWSHATENGWTAPLYWSGQGDRWTEFTLAGRIELDPRLPVTHISYFEADAFARWSSSRHPGVRLATEAEWEVASCDVPMPDVWADDRVAAGTPVHPVVRDDWRIRGMMGVGWQWTSSSYSAYPGYRVPPGALGEYNGKFMCNQYVLRGGSCATPARHLRRTYRNFFPPQTRWQFTTIRLARS